MKVKDIVTEAPFNPKQEKEFLSKLRSAEQEDGWPDQSVIAGLIQQIEPRATEIGSGMFGYVYGKPKGKSVIKTAHNDPDALRYLRWCLKNQSNPHVPKIYSIYTAKTGPKQPYHSFYVRMESLADIPQNFSWGEEHLPFLTLIDAEGGEVPGPVYAKAFGFRRYEEWQEMAALSDYFDNDKDYRQFVVDMRRAWKTNPLTQPLMAARKISGALDIGFGTDEIFQNAMMRPSTKEIVITDPVSS